MREFFGDGRQDVVRATVARSRIVKAVSARTPVTRVRARSAAMEAFKQAEFLMELRSRLPTLHATGFRGWAVSPDACLVLLDLVEALEPRSCVDLGAGLSTVVLGCATQERSLSSRVVGVDHDVKYAERTRKMLQDHGLVNAEVTVAPLRPTCMSSTDGGTPWYDFDSLQDIGAIDLLFVDGPPGRLGPNARRPSLRLADRMSPRCAVVLDDTNNPDIERLAHEWAKVLRGRLQFVPAEAGLGVVTRGFGLDEGMASALDVL